MRTVWIPIWFGTLTFDLNVACKVENDFMFLSPSSNRVSVPYLSDKAELLKSLIDIYCNSEMTFHKALSTLFRSRWGWCPLGVKAFERTTVT